MNLLKELSEIAVLTAHIQEGNHIPMEYTKDLAHARTYTAGFKHGREGGSAIDTSAMDQSLAKAYADGYAAGKKVHDASKPTAVRTDVSSIAGAASVGEAKVLCPHVKVSADGAAQGYNVSYKGRHLGHVFKNKGSWNAVDEASKKKWEFLKTKDEALEKLLDHNNVAYPHSLHPHQAVNEDLAAIADELEDVNDGPEKRTADQLEIGDEVLITGEVQFKGEPGKIVKFKDNGKKLVVVKLDDGGEHPFHSKDVSEREATEREPVQSGEQNKFYLAFYDHDEERAWIGLVSKEHGGKWHEKPYKGKPEYRWGHAYEAFLTPDDIRDTIGRSYPRSIEIEGPFFNSTEAEEHVAHNWGRISEGVKANLDEASAGLNRKIFNAYDAYDAGLGQEDEEKIEAAIERLNAIKPGLARKALNAINDGRSAKEFVDSVAKSISEEIVVEAAAIRVKTALNRVDFKKIDIDTKELKADINAALKDIGVKPLWVSPITFYDSKEGKAGIGFGVSKFDDSFVERDSQKAGTLGTFRYKHSEVIEKLKKVIRAHPELAKLIRFDRGHGVFVYNLFFNPKSADVKEADYTKTHKLVHSSGKTLKVGDKVKDFRGDEHVIQDWAPGAHEASTGRVYTDKGAFYPSVVDAKVVPLKKVSEESLDESQRLIKTVNGEHGRTAKVYKDADWEEYVVKFYENGVHLKDADYSTGDKTDAIQTAEHEAAKKIEEGLRNRDDIGDDEVYATTKSQHNDTVFIHDRIRSEADKEKVKKWYPRETVIFMKGSQIKKLKRVAHTTNVFDESVYTNYADWKQTILLSFPAQAKEIKFRGKMEGTKTIVIASHGDKVFGEWDDATNAGRILSEKSSNV